MEMPLNRGFSARLSSQTWIATEGQKIFTLSNSKYIPGKNLIEVFIDGIHQDSGVGYDETSSTSFTLSEGLPAGTPVEAKWYENALPSVGVGHSQTHKLGGQDELKISDLAGFDTVNSTLNSKVDKDYVDSKLTSIVSSTPKGVYNTLTELQAALPLGAQGIYVVLADGKWYFWNGSTWNVGGVYQSAAIASGGVSRSNLDQDVSTSITQTWNADSNLLYGIVDAEGRAVLTIDAEGTTKVFDLEVVNPLTLPKNSLPTTALEGVNTINSESSGILWGIVDAEGRLSDLILGEDGKIPDNILQDWKSRMGLGSKLNQPIVSVESIDSTVSGLSWGVIDNEGRMTEMVLGEDGQVPQWVLNQWKTRMGTPAPASITCWGDSLTAGAGGNGTTYPSVLQTLSGRTVYNMGVGGETSSTITARQGGTTMILDNLTIPAVKQKVQIFSTVNTRFTDNMGVGGISPLRQGGTQSINPCFIAGIEGTLTIQQTSSTSTDVVYFFERTVSGSVDTVINRPTPIITDAMIKRKNDIMVIFIGQNGGWNNVPADLTMQIKAMVDYSDNKNFVVIGLHTGASTDRAALETEMMRQFGRRYINIRDYMTKYGLADAGLTPTAQDTTDMASGKTPTSLMTDGTHFTAAGYTIIGNLVYKRMKELFIL